MQHQVTKVKFGRDTNQRKALLRSLLKELIKREHIETSLQKAKWTKKEIDKVITAAKKDSVSGARLVFKILDDNQSTQQILSLLPKLKSRNSGYTRIYKLGGRDGDNADMARIEFIFDESPVSVKKPRVKKVGAKRASPVSK